jgi:hypothetical protein
MSRNASARDLKEDAARHSSSKHITLVNTFTKQS